MIILLIFHKITHNLGEFLWFLRLLTFYRDSLFKWAFWIEDLNYDHCTFTRYFVPDSELSVVPRRNNMKPLTINYFYFNLTFKNYNLSLFFLEMIEPYNHKMVWVCKDLKDRVAPMPLLLSESPSTTPGCSSNLSLDTFRNRTSFPDNMFQYPITLTVKNFFLLSHLILLSFTLKIFLLVLSLCILMKVPLHLSCRLSLGTGRPCWGLPRAFSSSG